MALILMVCLAAIAAGLYAVQFRFNPAVANFLTGPAAALKPPAAKPGDAALLFPLPDDVVLLTPVEHFDRETLSEKINGKAELYLSAGFLRLDCQRISPKGRTDSWMEVFVYDMGSAQNAYAVFSLQRRADSLPLDLAEFAYRAENALFMVHGPYYLEIIASEKNAELTKSMTSLARAFMDSRPVSTTAIAERDLFPEAGLDKRSINLIPADAFGVSGLDRVFTAIYRKGASEATAFLSKRATPQEAEDLGASYLEFLKTYGGQLEASDQRVPGAVIIAILDAYEVVFAQGPYLAGVHESTDKDMAVTLARQLFEKLKEDTGAR
jgi:hypothetical protein